MKSKKTPQVRDSILFEVQGAGHIAISPSSTYSSGTARGCAFDCSWTRYGYSGGVMDIEEMIRLRALMDHLIEIYPGSKKKRKA